jgi:Pyridoxamine 5'-phosphate oxidase
MASWEQVVHEAPELAAAVRERFAARKHATMATLRADGSPRISGTEVEFADGQIWLGSMPGAMKALDLRRDPRMALHSPSVDPPEDDPESWPGEAKVAGRAVEVDAGTGPGEEEAHRFRIEVAEVVLTRVRGSELVIESWHPGRGLEKRTRR